MEKNTDEKNSESNSDGFITQVGKKLINKLRGTNDLIPQNKEANEITPLIESSYRLGRGFNSINSTIIKDKSAIKKDLDVKPNPDCQSSSYTAELLYHSTNFKREFSGAVGAKIPLSTIPVTVDLKAAFSIDTTKSMQTFFYIVRIYEESYFLEYAVDNVSLSETSQKLLFEDRDEFFRTYGDSYISKKIHGKELLCILKFECKDESKTIEFMGKFNTGNIGGEISTTTKSTDENEMVKCQLKLIQTGVQVPYPQNIPGVGENKTTRMSNIIQWLTSVNDQFQKSKVEPVHIYSWPNSYIDIAELSSTDQNTRQSLRQMKKTIENVVEYKSKISETQIRFEYMTPCVDLFKLHYSTSEIKKYATFPEKKQQELNELRNNMLYMYNKTIDEIELELQFGREKLNDIIIISNEIFSFVKKYTAEYTFSKLQERHAWPCFPRDATYLDWPYKLKIEDPIDNASKFSVKINNKNDKATLSIRKPKRFLRYVTTIVPGIPEKSNFEINPLPSTIIAAAKNGSLYFLYNPYIKNKEPNPDSIIITADYQYLEGTLLSPFEMQIRKSNNQIKISSPSKEEITEEPIEEEVRKKKKRHKD